MNDITQITELIGGGAPDESTPLEQNLPPAEGAPIEDSQEIEQEQEQVADASGEDQAITSFTDFVNELEIDPKEAYNLNVQLSDDLPPVSISELKDFYQASKLQGNNAQDLQQQNVQLRDQLTQLQQFQGAAPPMAEELQRAMGQINAINTQYNEIDWPRFEQENPGEAALQRQKLQEAHNQAVSNRNNVAHNLENVANERKQQYLTYQQSQVRQLIPEWTDTKVAQREATDMATLMTNYGFQEQEINNINEARILKMVRDFMVLQNKVTNSKPATKKVHNTGVTLTAGALRLAKKSKAQKRSEIVDGFRGNKDSRQQAEAVRALLSNV